MLSDSEVQSYRYDIASFVNDLIWFLTKRKNEKIILYDYQEDILNEATSWIKIDGEERRKYSVVCIGLPKRNSKTFSASLIGIHQLVCFYNCDGVVASNSKDQASSTAFDTMKKILRNSPELRSTVGSANILEREIKFLDAQSKFVVISSEKASSWGYGIDIGIVDEIHAAPDGDGLYQVLASQTADKDGLVILPSQVSSKACIFYHLWKLAGEPEYEYEEHEGIAFVRGKKIEDPRIFFVYMADDPKKPKPIRKYNPSPLVKEYWLESRKLQLTQQEYDAYHRNIWVGGSQKLFKQDRIEEAFNLGMDFKAPVDKDTIADIESQFGTKLIIGGALDRAQPFSQQGDRTVWTVVGKGFMSGFRDDLHFYIVLNQIIIHDSDESRIKEEIENDDIYYKLRNTIIESYQAADIFRWCEEDRGMPCEFIHATANKQIDIFTELYQIVDTERLIIPSNLEVDPENRDQYPYLRVELEEFEQTMFGAIPKFGHPGKHSTADRAHKKKKLDFHDDTVYSLGEAIYSLRDFKASSAKKRRKGFGPVHEQTSIYTGR